jgi:hypothetical protein
MKYLIVFCLLVSACTSVRKSVNQTKQDVNKSSLLQKDSTGKLLIDTIAVSQSIGWIVYSSDSGYDKITEEVVKEIFDSNTIRRETTRTIKEKGQKRVELNTQLSKYDSARKMVEKIAEVKQMQKNDSEAVTVTTQKEIKRTSFMPWWLWLIAAIPVLIIAWLKRTSIIKYFT